MKIRIPIAVNESGGWAVPAMIEYGTKEMSPGDRETTARRSIGLLSGGTVHAIRWIEADIEPAEVADIKPVIAEAAAF